MNEHAPPPVIPNEVRDLTFFERYSSGGEEIQASSVRSLAVCAAWDDNAKGGMLALENKTGAVEPSLK